MGKSNSHSIKVIERSTLKNENVDSNAFPASNSDTILVGRISDLLEDIKHILFTIRKSKKRKDAAVRHFQSLLSHYPLIGKNYSDTISLFIYDACNNEYHIHLPLPEIRSWWPTRIKKK